MQNGLVPDRTRPSAAGDELPFVERVGSWQWQHDALLLEHIRTNFGMPEAGSVSALQLWENFIIKLIHDRAQICFILANRRIKGLIECCFQAVIGSVLFAIITCVAAKNC